MRNIAVLDWGPTNLAFTPGREKVQLRTPFIYENGPELPPFLLAKDELQFLADDDEYPLIGEYISREQKKK